MNRTTLFGGILLLLSVVGCNEPSVPVNPKAPAGTNPHVSGSPEERIKAIQENATLSPEEKAFRIKAIKERNNIQ